MKTYLYILIGTFTFLLSSCYEDKGNYNYNDIDEIQVEFPGNMGKDGNILYAEKLGNKLSIHPNVKYNDPSALKYDWSLFTQGSDTQILKHSKDLDITLEYGENALIAWNAGGYSLQFTATDTITKQSIRKLVHLSVRSITPVGVYVMDGDKDSTDVSTIEDDDFLDGLESPILTKNYYSSVNGSKLKGEGKNVCWYFTQNNDIYTGIVLCTDQDVRTISLTNFKTARTMKQLTSNTPVKGKLMGYVSYAGGGNGMLYTESNLYNMAEDDAPTSVQFENEIKRGGIVPGYFFSDGGSLGGNLNYSDLSFDKSKEHFVQFDWYNEPSTQYEWPINLLGDDPNGPVFNPSDMKGTTLIGLDYGTATYYLTSQQQWAMLRKTSDNSIIACRINDTAYDNDAPSYDIYKTISTDRKNTELQDMNCFQMSPLTDGLGFFSTPSGVFNLDIINGTDISQIFSPDNSDEQITKIKILKYNYMDGMDGINSTFTGRKGLSLYITTWDGQQGRLYRLPLTEEGQADNSRPTDKWEGFKEIKDICFRLQ